MTHSILYKFELRELPQHFFLVLIREQAVGHLYAKVMFETIYQGLLFRGMFC